MRDQGGSRKLVNPGPVWLILPLSTTLSVRGQVDLCEFVFLAYDDGTGLDDHRSKEGDYLVCAHTRHSERGWGARRGNGRMIDENFSSAEDDKKS
jgi:hypothetical protein